MKDYTNIKQIPFEKWIDEAKQIFCRLLPGMEFPEDADSWQQAYRDGDSPEDAVRDELSYWVEQ